jgi:hypothetical protein
VGAPQVEVETVALEDAATRWPSALRTLVCERDYEAERFYDERGTHKDVYYCNCGRMVTGSGFCKDMRDILTSLKDEYDHHVDVEFTVNYGIDDEYVINILQCRPLQIQGQRSEVTLPTLAWENLFFSLEGNTMGGGVDLRLDYVVTVDPRIYAELDLSGKYETARTIGRINQTLTIGKETTVMLVGPGRWGTRSPDLGVPVSFAEICGIAALCEVSMAEGNVRPDLSFGSHFFQDLVEANIFFAAIMPERDDCVFLPAALHRAKNIVGALPSGAVPEGSPIRVYDVIGANLWLKADVPSGKCVCGFVPQQ